MTLLSEMEKWRSDWQHGTTSSRCINSQAVLNPAGTGRQVCTNYMWQILVLAPRCWNLCHLRSSTKSVNLGIKSRTKFQTQTFHKWFSHSSGPCLCSLLSGVISAVVADAPCSVGHRQRTLHIYFLAGTEAVLFIEKRCVSGVNKILIL